MRNRARVHWLSRLACGTTLCIGVVLGMISSSPDLVQANITSSPGMTCTGTINGVDVGARSVGSVSDSIDIPEHTQVAVHMASSAPIFRRLIRVDFLGLSNDDVVGRLIGGNVQAGYIADDTNDVRGSSWDKTIDVDSYSRYGIGVYRVDASSSGPNGTCEMKALVRIKGNPLSSVAGEAGAAAGVIGLLGLGVSGARAAGEGGGDDSGGSDGSAGDGEGSDDPLTVAAVADPLSRDFMNFSLCAFWIIPALLLTIRAMVVGGPPPEPEPGGELPPPPPPEPAVSQAPIAAAAATRERPVPRARWRLKLSFIAILSGFIGSLGVVVFLQQAGLIFPTGTLLLLALVIGVVLGIVVPSLFRLIAVRRVNRRIAARYARARQQRTAPPA